MKIMLCPATAVINEDQSSKFSKILLFLKHIFFNLYTFAHINGNYIKEDFS